MAIWWWVAPDGRRWLLAFSPAVALVWVSVFDETLLDVPTNPSSGLLIVWAGLVVFGWVFLLFTVAPARLARQLSPRFRRLRVALSVLAVSAWVSALWLSGPVYYAADKLDYCLFPSTDISTGCDLGGLFGEIGG